MVGGRTLRIAALGRRARDAGAPPAHADDDARDEAERRGRCSGGGDASLRVRARDGVLRIELELEPAGKTRAWRVILLHERRTAFRGVGRARGDGSYRLRRRLPDWVGTDTVTARATAAGGEVCLASVTVLGR